ncbi:hypothetical protein V8E36_004700 [Tilletia maclaganii]
MTSRTALAASLAEATAAAARAEAQAAAAAAAAAARAAPVLLDGAGEGSYADSAADAMNSAAATLAGLHAAATTQGDDGINFALLAMQSESKPDTAIPVATATPAVTSPQPQQPTKKKHPNQWTYRKKDPNKPHPNQYTYRAKNGKSVKARPPAKKRKHVARSDAPLSDQDAEDDFVEMPSRSSATPSAQLLASSAASGSSHALPSQADVKVRYKRSSSPGTVGPSPSLVPASAAAVAVTSIAGSSSARDEMLSTGVLGAGSLSSSSRDAALAAAAASEQAAAARARAAEAKQKEKREREKERKRKAKEEEEAAAAAEEEAEMLLDDKLYCVCKTLYDEERMMIACDNCDEWYHTQCMGMSDTKAELVDMFVCPACEPLTHERTTYKAKCLYASCTHAALRPLSQFCSERCGILHAGTKIARGRFGRSNPVAAAAALGFEPSLTPSMFGGGGVEKLLFSREVQSGKKREGMVVWADGAAEQLPGWGPSSVDEDPGALLRRQLADLQQHRAAIVRSQSLARARLRLVHLAVKRAEAIPSARPSERGSDAAESSGGGAAGNGRQPTSDPIFRNKNKKRKGADEVIEALVKNSWMRCGFDERLMWGDVRLAEWIESAEGRAMLGGEVKLDGRIVEDGLDCSGHSGASGGRRGPTDGTSPIGVCGLAKRKCKRHADWAAIRETDLKTELEEQTRSLQKFDEQEGFVRSRLDALNQSRRAQQIIATASDAAIAASLLRASRRPPTEQ